MVQTLWPTSQMRFVWLSGFGRNRPRPAADSASLQVVLSPVRDVGCQQRSEQLSVVGDAQVQEFVCDDEILKAGFLVGQVSRKGNGPRCRAGAPLSGHVLNAHQPRADGQLLRPEFHATANYPAPFLTGWHLCLWLTGLRAWYRRCGGVQIREERGEDDTEKL